MENTNVVKAFHLFVSTDELRPNMLKPFKEKGTYYATNGMVMLSTKADHITLPFEEMEELNAWKVVPQERDHNESIPIDLLKLKAWLGKNTRMIDEVIESSTQCKKCEGHGSLECDLGHMHMCEKCEGEGDIYTHTRTDRVVPDPDATIRLNGIGYRVELIQKLIDAGELLGKTKAVKVYGRFNTAGLFLLDEFTVLIMPFLINDHDLPVLDLTPDEVSY